ELDEMSVLRHRPDILHARHLVGRDAEQVAAPDAGVLLLLHDLLHGRLVFDLQTQRVELRRREQPRKDVRGEPKPNRWSGVGHEPSYWYLVTYRKSQVRAPWPGDTCFKRATNICA